MWLQYYLKPWTLLNLNKKLTINRTNKFKKKVFKEMQIKYLDKIYALGSYYSSLSIIKTQ